MTAIPTNGKHSGCGHSGVWHEAMTDYVLAHHGDDAERQRLALLHEFHGGLTLTPARPRAGVHRTYALDRALPQIWPAAVGTIILAGGSRSA
jgi:hypothetical protein